MKAKYGLLIFGTMGLYVIVIALILFWFAVTHKVSSQVLHQHPSQDMDLHDKFYSHWNIPPAREYSCCNKQDCYPTSFKQEGGRWYAQKREDLSWVLVPEDKLEHNQLEPEESPDGQSHVCMLGSTILCAVLGSGQ